ncbi:acyltransferase [Colwellia piezophila]|uniref:acyltransferase n=1 Tax=Colwellia piezophila TaxID=211668 RepID=UPI00036BF976|nr:acyltransferase [Colwellia piezophila]
MAYLSAEELTKLGFLYLGKNVKISDKASIYNCEQISIGNNTRIDDFCILSGKLTLGSNIHLAPFVLLAGGDEGIIMDDFSGCAYHVQIFSQSDDYSGKTMTNPTIPVEYKNEFKKAVSIGKHAIIGASSIIFPGVSLAEGCSVGALTLVNKSTKPWGIYLGNPAKRIKDRCNDLLKLEQQFLKASSDDFI